ncbi:hypothetical protein OG21DRAFT_1526324 [Imleria badia]|nr:hypothetical protein OG21DRAFT_1526324 [Imleria badia]
MDVRNLSAINIRSSEQWERHLVPLFSRNQGAVDLYLSRVVFPKYAKECPWKISGSSWDIAERKNHLVTVSVTVPTSIRQDDPDHLNQTGTNAMVLANLLHQDNDHYMVTACDNGERWTTLELLRMIVAQKPEIHVLLDVDLTPAYHTARAIYFTTNDGLVVLTRNGTVQPLLSSPLVQRLDQCVAYLDDVHTRGTDIKFPRGFRAAVTLGSRRQGHKRSFGQPEIKSLADLYAPRHDPSTTCSVELDTGIHQRCKSLGASSLSDARLDEEQEREVSHEIEREQETVRPHGAKPANHSLHPDVIEFVSNGVLHLHHSTAFRAIFTTLANSSAATGEPRTWSPYILATADFCNTIIEGGSFQGRVDEYFRLVQWILSGKKDGNDVLVVLSPFEADELMPYIMLSEHVHLHLYTPRTTERMKPCDDLKWYSIPALPADWTPLGSNRPAECVCWIAVSQGLHIVCPALPSAWLEPEIEITFDDSPLLFVMMLLAIRRRGMGFAKTHMGSILRGQLLTDKDFQGPAPPIVHYGFSTATE